MPEPRAHALGCPVSPFQGSDRINSHFPLHRGAMVRIAVIPGDGIGPEVTTQAVRVVETVARCGARALETVFFDFGAEKYLREGVSLPPNALGRFRSEFDAILLGALGDPRVPDNKHVRDILFGIRFGLD